MTRGACKVARLHLDPADTQVLDRWCENGTDTRDRRVSAYTLAAALRADGHDIGATTLKDHRAGRCACWKD